MHLYFLTCLKVIPANILISRQDLYLHCKLSGLERVGRSADICGLTESEEEMAIRVQKHSCEQRTQYKFLEKDLNTLRQLREAIIKIFRGQTNVGNHLIVISPIYCPQDSDLWRFNLDDYTNLISFYTLRKAIIKMDDRIKLY